MAAPTRMSPQELRGRLDTAGAPLVLDVREPEELALARFPGAVEIPMSQIVSRVDELGRDAEIVVLCHHGVRSAQVAAFLADQGFARVANLVGGIDAWSSLVDPRVPRY